MVALRQRGRPSGTDQCRRTVPTVGRGAPLTVGVLGAPELQRAAPTPGTNGCTGLPRQPRTRTLSQNQTSSTWAFIFHMIYRMLKNLVVHCMHVALLCTSLWLCQLDAGEVPGP